MTLYYSGYMFSSACMLIMLHFVFILISDSWEKPRPTYPDTLSYWGKVVVGDILPSGNASSMSRGAEAYLVLF